MARARPCLLSKPAVDTLSSSPRSPSRSIRTTICSRTTKVVRDAINDPVADARIAGVCSRMLDSDSVSWPRRTRTFGRVMRGLSDLGMRSISPQAQAGMDLCFAEICAPPRDPRCRSGATSSARKPARRLSASLLPIANCPQTPSWH
jgi:hypothetical protein